MNEAEMNAELSRLILIADEYEVLAEQANRDIDDLERQIENEQWEEDE